MTDESKRFIKWAEKELEKNAHSYFIDAQYFISLYQLKKNGTIKKALIEKLTKAAEEYGDPISNKDKYNFAKEMEMEVIDLVFGWPMVKKYIMIYEKRKLHNGRSGRKKPNALSRGKT